MLDKATLNKLREMKLAAMAEKLEWQHEQPEIQKLSFEERFGMLVDAEWLEKHNRRISRYINKAKFRFPATIKDIDYKQKRGITKADILRLSSCMYIQQHQNVILSGPTGVGKTYIACALGRCACEQNLMVSYIRVADLFLALGEARATSSSAS